MMPFQRRKPDTEASYTALIRAAKDGKRDEVASLLNTEDPEERDSNALHHAACQGHKEVAELLILSAHCDQKDDDRNTPLMKAASNGHTAVVELLLKTGANVSEVNIDGCTALIFASSNGRRDCVQLLIDAGADLEHADDNECSALMRAATNDHIDVVEMLLANGAGVDCRDNNGCTPLIRAAKEGHSKVVEILLEAGANIEEKDWNGMTALIWAADIAPKRVIELLLKQGANIEAKDNSGFTPLMMASKDRPKEIVDLLLTAGARLEERNHWGSVALALAASNGQHEVCELLLRKGINMEAKDNYGSTPLIRAAKNGHLQIVDLLLRARVNVDEKDWKGNTAQFYAAQEGHKDVEALLISTREIVKSSMEQQQMLKHTLTEKEKELNSMRHEMLKYKEMFEKEQRRSQQSERKRQEELQKWTVLQTQDRFALLVKTLSDISTRRATTDDHSATDDMCRVLLNETQAIRDFKQGQHYANGEIRELDDCVTKFRQLQGSIQEVCVKPGNPKKTPGADDAQLSGLIGQRNELRETSLKQISKVSTTLQQIKRKQEDRIAYLEELIPTFQKLLSSMSAPSEEHDEDNALSEFSSPAQIAQICDQYRSWKALVQEANEIKQQTNQSLDTFVTHLLREADITLKVEKGSAKYDKVARLAEIFTKKKLPFEKQSLIEQNLSTNALFQQYSILLDEFRVSQAQNKESSELEQQQTALSLKIKKAEKEHSWKAGIKAHLEQFAESDEEKEQLEKTKQELIILNTQLSDLKREQRQLVEHAYGLVQRGFPEMARFCVSTTGSHGSLVVQRTVSDYEELRRLPHRPNIIVAKYQSKRCVLKEYNIISTGPSAPRGFEKEVSILSKLNHPLIIKIEAVFYDGIHVYLHMPFYEIGTLGDWLYGRDKPADITTDVLSLSSSPATPLLVLSPSAPRRAPRVVQQKPWKIQHVLQQVLQGLAFLHQNHIIHRDIKLENILMRSETQPIITDFDISKDGTQTRKTSLSRSPGTAEYMAPELLGAEPTEATAASDMWSFGVVMLRALFPQAPCVLLPGKEHVSIPSHDSLPLRSLLQNLLSADPQKRLSAEEALVHPFFSTSMVEELQSSGQLLETDRKLDVFRKFLSNLKQERGWFEYDKEEQVLMVSPHNVVDSVLCAFERMGNEDLLYPLFTEYENQQGVDAGALTTSMYRQFFEEIFKPEHRLFERSELGMHYLPVQNPDKQQVARLESFARVLLKAIIDERTISVPLCSAVFKHLLGIKPNFRDLEVYDPELFRSLQRLLAVPNAENWAGLDFTGLSPQGEHTPVTDDNKHQFVQHKLDSLLVGSRRAGLDAIKTGFWCVKELQAHLALLSPVDVQLLVRGREFLSAEMVVPLLTFRGFPAESPTPQALLDHLTGMTQIELKQFLLFTTEQDNIPVGGLVNPNHHSPYPRDKVTVCWRPKSADLPQAHVCMYQLDLPDYGLPEVLGQKLMTAIQNTQTFELH